MALSDLAPSFEPSLTEHGFALTATQSGFGSGGPYEVGVWTRGDRRFSISLRYDSLAVGYRIGDIGMDHAAYMRALLGPAGPNLFPSYSHDAAAASVALGHDLRHHCDDFLGGDGSAFRRLAADVRAERATTGFQRLRRTERKLHPD